MDKHKISISFKAERMHIYNFLKRTDGIKDNISAYICNLIEQDIKNNSAIPLEEQVKVLVQQYVCSYISDASQITTQNQATNSLTSEDIDLINNLF